MCKKLKLEIFFKALLQKDVIRRLLVRNLIDIKMNNCLNESYSNAHIYTFKYI